MRSFLRYLRYRGEIALDLAAAVPTVPNWSVAGIPRAMDPDHVRAVLASCKRGTAVVRELVTLEIVRNFHPFLAGLPAHVRFQLIGGVIFECSADPGHSTTLTMGCVDSVR